MPKQSRRKTQKQRGGGGWWWPFGGGKKVAPLPSGPPVTSVTSVPSATSVTPVTSATSVPLPPIKKLDLNDPEYNSKRIEIKKFAKEDIVKMVDGKPFYSFYHAKIIMTLPKSIRVQAVDNSDNLIKGTESEIDKSNLQIRPPTNRSVETKRGDINQFVIGDIVQKADYKPFFSFFNAKIIRTSPSDPSLQNNYITVQVLDNSGDVIKGTESDINKSNLQIIHPANTSVERLQRLQHIKEQEELDLKYKALLDSFKIGELVDYKREIYKQIDRSTYEKEGDFTFPATIIKLEYSRRLGDGPPHAVIKYNPQDNKELPKWEQESEWFKKGIVEESVPLTALTKKPLTTESLNKNHQNNKPRRSKKLLRKTRRRRAI